jgi:hypothetical protein
MPSIALLYKKRSTIQTTPVFVVPTPVKISIRLDEPQLEIVVYKVAGYLVLYHTCSDKLLEHQPTYLVAYAHTSGYIPVLPDQCYKIFSNPASPSAVFRGCHPLSCYPKSLLTSFIQRLVLPHPSSTSPILSEMSFSYNLHQVLLEVLQT